MKPRHCSSLIVMHSLTMLLMIVSGCGRAPVAAPAANATGSGSVTPSVTPPVVAPDAKADHSSPAPGSNAGNTTSSTTAEVASTEELNAGPAPKSNAVPAPTPTAPQTHANPVASLAPPQASPEQVAKWALPNYSPMKLLACYDNFSDGLVRSAAIAPNGQQLAVGGTRLTLWSLDNPQPIKDIIAQYDGQALERPIGCLAYSPDGKLLAAGDQQGNLRLFATDDSSKVVTLKAHRGRLMALAFSPGSTKLATTSYSGDVRIWSMPEGKPLKEFKASKLEIAELLFLNDEQLVVGSGETGIWNVTSGSLIAPLTKEYVISPSIALTPDRKLLAFVDKDGEVKFWNVEQKSIAERRTLVGSNLQFSPDGKLLAGCTNELILIWDLASGQLVQTIDSPGGRPVQLAWLPGHNVLMSASEIGRIRLWGQPEMAGSLKLPKFEEPELAAARADARQPLSSEQMARIIDLRSLPTLPDAVRQIQQFAMVGYQTAATEAEAMLFYRVQLAAAGWQELSSEPAGYPGLNFTKSGCRLNVSFSPAHNDPRQPAAASEAAKLQVNLQLMSNVDVRLLPKYEPLDTPNNYAFYSAVGYRTRADITDLEVALIKQLHQLGWTPYARLDASSLEEPDVRRLAFMQNGSQLLISIGYPGDSKSELVVQMNVSAENKTVAIPPDCGWIEYDSSTAIKLVANTSLSLPETIQFYDQTMAAQGWSARPPRVEKEELAWLPYVRGGQDLFVRLVKLPEGKTRILIGEVERSSWQLIKPDDSTAATAKPGIEAADYKLPDDAQNVKYDVDQKNIDFTVDKIKPTALGDQFVAVMNALGWKQDGAGTRGDDYTFITFEKDKVEIDLRARWDETRGTSAMIGGDGLLWNKPLPTAPVRVSYEAWLRRSRRPTSLEFIDEFHAQMKKIPWGGSAGR